MFEKPHKVEVSAQELAVIEAALHTQSKILDVQAGVGGSAARAQLNEVKQVLARLAAQKPTQKKPCRQRGIFGFRMLRLFG